MSYKVNNGSDFFGLTIADDRFAAFETIRDANDPLMQDRRMLGNTPLTDSDYFATLPLEETPQFLYQKRLHAIIEHTKRTEVEKQKAAEKDRKEAAKFSF